MIAYGTKPMELKQDIRAIENEPIKTRLESLKETSAVLWNARQKLEQLFCMQMYIASEILPLRFYARGFEH